MRIASFLLALPILIASCGRAADPIQLTKDGETALGSKDAAGAAGHFDAALTAIGADKAHPMYVRAKLGMAEAYAGSNPSASKDILEGLVKELPGKLTSKDFTMVMNKMAESTVQGAIGVTTKTLEVALLSFPEAKSELDKFGQFLAVKAAKSGDPEAKNALDSLGYTGGD